MAWNAVASSTCSFSFFVCVTFPAVTPLSSSKMWFRSQKEVTETEVPIVLNYKLQNPFLNTVLTYWMHGRTAGCCKKSTKIKPIWVRRRVMPMLWLSLRWQSNFVRKVPHLPNSTTNQMCPGVFQSMTVMTGYSFHLPFYASSTTFVSPLFLYSSFFLWALCDEEMSLF